MARRMRWLSPPDRVAAPAQGQVLEAHRPQEAQAVLDLLQDPLGDACIWVSAPALHEVQGLVHRLVAEGVDVHAPTVTARASFPQALAPQVGQGHSLMHSSSSRRMASDWVSR